MMNTKNESDEVLYSTKEIISISGSDIEELKRLAQQNARKKIRICTHRKKSDLLHEMFIIHTNECYVRPHKHIKKVESISVLEGIADIVLFHDDGEIKKITRVGPPSSGLAFYHKLDQPIYHTLLVRSDFFVFHEVTQGPFVSEETVFPSWAPSVSQFSQHQFLEQIKRFEHISMRNE
ncbi:cupin [Candidatus Poribacteria bacterium]|nr:cupin [Candidatus Poribacteria bacterium]